MLYVVRCAIWYHLYYLKNVKNTHGGLLLLVKLEAKAWVFSTFLKLHKWYQIAQNTTYCQAGDQIKAEVRLRSQIQASVNVI